jgi:hypothetical protein
MKNKSWILIIFLFFILLYKPYSIYAETSTNTDSSDGDSSSTIIDKEMTVYELVDDIGVNYPKLIGYVLDIARIGSIFLTVIVLTIMGVKSMFSSIEQKAIDQKRFVNVAIGVIFLSLFINIIISIFELVDSLKLEIV